MTTHPESSPALASPDAWWAQIEAIGPASVLVVIRSWMSDALLQRTAPEDVWQETLLHAWRDREKLVWQGRAAFRKWMLGIARNRVLDLVDRETAGKRGGLAMPRPLGGDPSGSSTASPGASPMATTTPSRTAMELERAAAMRRALAALPESLQDVVRLRLFEDASMQEIASRLGLGVEGVRHRFRKGLEAYREELRKAMLGTRSS